MRTFLAVFPSATARAAAARVVERLRDGRDDVAWVRDENLHYTLRFLGELDEGAVAGVIAAAGEAAAGHRPFTLTLGAAGAFPDARRARVLWLGAAGGGEALTALAASLERALAGRGFAPDPRGFAPHLTLGRLRRGAADWSARLAGVAAGPVDGGPPSFPVDRVAVVASTLAPGGSRYRVRAEAPLGA